MGGGPGALSLRPATAADQPLLREALVDNVNWCGPRLTREQVLDHPGLCHYVAGYPRIGDLGLVACLDGRAVGAAWARLFAHTERGYGWVADDWPELSLWVVAGDRGRGIGGALLLGLIETARAAGRPGLSLSVEDGNPARRLYERCGFQPAEGSAEGVAAGTLRRRL